MHVSKRSEEGQRLGLFEEIKLHCVKPYSVFFPDYVEKHLYVSDIDRTWSYSFSQQNSRLKDFAAQLAHCLHPTVWIHLSDVCCGSPFIRTSVSPAANGYTSARASPGLLTVSNSNSLGKVVPAKSPPPPPSPQINSRKPDLRVITSQGGKSLMQMVRPAKPNLDCIHLTFWPFKVWHSIQITSCNY